MIILIFINLLFSFNINDTNHDNWNDVSNYLSEEKVNLIRNYIDSYGDLDTIYDLLNIEGIDYTKTFTNDIRETQSVLGLEAARETLL